RRRWAGYPEGSRFRCGLPLHEEPHLGLHVPAGCQSRQGVAAHKADRDRPIRGRLVSTQQCSVRQVMDVIIYHNPDCGTSRNTLALIRNAGVEPHVVESLKPPPSRDMLALLSGRMGIPVRELLREKGTSYAELGLGDAALSDAQLLDAMMAHPILINRPIVVSPKGVKLCRPSEDVLDLLPPQRGAFVKEDGERVIDEHGRRVATT